MWEMIKEGLPDARGMFFTFIAFFVPYMIYKINTKLHKDGDPPWKVEERNQMKQKQSLNKEKGNQTIQKQPSN
ncbi:hypothetical protein [Oceanobacillus saliphilus]|uniref:hypothetical protein n=1 Tax=Oceanobacillus saliphilus TaxID=2925834 RepID=UPI00201DA628|nr:hypothetical protein [Oceanobacillus saliphilus]